MSPRPLLGEAKPIDGDVRKPKMTVRRTGGMPEPKPPTWLAVGHILNAAITVLVGDEGIGKSLWWVLLVAHITTGRALPAVGLPARKPRDVLLIVTEDSWSEVRARLLLAGADLDRVHLVSEDEDGSGSPVFPDDMQLVLDATRGLDVALIVVDAWLDTVSGGLQVRDTQQARSALHPWKEAATRTGAAVLLLVNTNRIQEGTTRDKVGGTAALRQKARMLLFAAAKPEQEGVRLFIGPDKSNTAGRQCAVAYDVLVRQVHRATQDDPGTVAILGNPVVTDLRITGHIAQWKDEQREAARPLSADEKAEKWLVDYLAQHNNQVAANQVKDAAKLAGHSPERVVSIIKQLGGKSAPMTKGGPYFFQLPNGQETGANQDSEAGAHLSKPSESRQSSESWESPATSFQDSEDSEDSGGLGDIGSASESWSGPPPDTRCRVHDVNLTPAGRCWKCALDVAHQEHPAKCTACGEPLDPAATVGGFTTHPACERAA
jgi:AAA domain